MDELFFQNLSVIKILINYLINILIYLFSEKIHKPNILMFIKEFQSKYIKKKKC